MKLSRQVITSVIERTLIDLREPCTPTDRQEARLRLDHLVRAIRTDNTQDLYET